MFWIVINSSANWIYGKLSYDVLGAICQMEDSIKIVFKQLKGASSEASNSKFSALYISLRRIYINELTYKAKNLQLDASDEAPSNNLATIFIQIQ